MSKGQAGYTLAEVIISMLLVVIMASAVYHLALTSLASGNKVDRKVIAQQAQRHLSERLQQYVTSDTNNSLAIAGPNGNINAGAWKWTNETGEDGRTITDSCVGCYVLATGNHRLTGYLPQWLEAGPYNGTISYVVTNQTVSGTTGMTGQSVVVNVTWSEP